MTTEAIVSLRAAIKQHLETHGARDWKLVRGNFPGISDATFWRQVKAVRGAPVSEEGFEPPPSEPARTQYSPDFNPQKSVERYEQLILEAEEMCRQARDANGKIVNWRMVAKAVELRRSLLEEQFNVARDFYNAARLKNFVQKVKEVLGSESPEVREKLVARLAAAQNDILGI